MKADRSGALRVDERGFLLAELSVALAVILPLMLIFTGTLYSLTRTQAQSSVAMDAADQVRYAMQQLQNDLQSVNKISQLSSGGFSAVLDKPSDQTQTVEWSYNQSAGTLERSVDSGPEEVIASGLSGVSFSYLGPSGLPESNGSCVSRVEVWIKADPTGALAAYTQDLGVNLHDVASPGEGSC